MPGSRCRSVPGGRGRRLHAHRRVRWAKAPLSPPLHEPIEVAPLVRAIEVVVARGSSGVDDGVDRVCAVRRPLGCTWVCVRIRGPAHFDSILHDERGDRRHLEGRIAQLSAHLSQETRPPQELRTIAARAADATTLLMRLLHLPRRSSQIETR